MEAYRAQKGPLLSWGVQRYEDTQHYAVTGTFLQDPAASLRKLFAEAEES